MYNVQPSSSSTMGAGGQPPPSASAPLDSRRKIRRPPNAFMLYARENRKTIAEQNPQVNNKNISTMLGNLWRGLDSFTKESYFEKARAMDKLHKQKYPGYVYNPKEARLKKQNREMSKRMKKQPENGTPRSGVLSNSVTSGGILNIRNGAGTQLNETGVNVVKMEFYEDNSDRNNDETFKPEYTPNNPMTFTDPQRETLEDRHSTPRTHAFQPPHRTSAPQQTRMPPRNGNRPNGSWYASPDEPGALFAAPPGGQMYHTSTPRPVPYGMRCYAGSQEGPRYFPGPHESSNWNQFAKGYEGRYYMQPYDFSQPRMASQPHFFRPPPGPPSATQTSESSSSSECNAEASNSPSAYTNKPLAMYPLLRFPVPYPAYYPANLNMEAYYSGSVYGMDPEDMASGSYDTSFAWPIAPGGYFRGMPMGRPYRQHEPPSTCQSSRRDESQQRQSPCVIVDENVDDVKTDDVNGTVPPVLSIAATAFENIVSNSFTVLNYSADSSSGRERAPVGQRKSPPKKSSLWRTNV